MSHFLHLHDWLNAGEALSYLKLYGIEVTLPDLVKAYRTRQFDMQLDFKDPATYALKLEGAKTYPHSLFNVNRINNYQLQHENGKVIRLLFPEKVSTGYIQNGFGSGETVWIYSCLDEEPALDENFKNTPVYLRWEGHRTDEYRHDFEILTWGLLFSSVPNLLLFERENLDSLVRSEKQANTNMQNSESQIAEKVNLGSKERNTLLILIAALCREAKVDYKQRGISTAIQKMTEEIGAPVTDDTINRVLKQIESALDSRSK